MDSFEGGSDVKPKKEVNFYEVFGIVLLIVIAVYLLFIIFPVWIFGWLTVPSAMTTIAKTILWIIAVIIGIIFLAAMAD